MSKVLAMIGGAAITDADVDQFLMELGPRGQSYNNPEGRKMVLEQLIGTRLMLLDAKRNLLEAEPAFKAQLAKLKDSLLANYAMEKVLAAVTVTDAEAKAYYDENSDKFVTGESVNASHILVDSADAALDILAKINSGEMSFEDAAIQYSSCPSKANGGNLGDFGRGQMVPEFDKAVFEMEVGEISKVPVQTQFGYHLIKLNAKNESQTAPYESIAEEIKESLLSEKRRKAYESKINQLKILYPVDKML